MKCTRQIQFRLNGYDLDVTFSVSSKDGLSLDVDPSLVFVNGEAVDDHVYWSEIHGDLMEELSARVVVTYAEATTGKVTA